MDTVTANRKTKKLLRRMRKVDAARVVEPSFVTYRSLDMCFVCRYKHEKMMLRQYFIQGRHNVHKFTRSTMSDYAVLVTSTLEVC